MKHLKLFLSYSITFIFILFLMASFAGGRYLTEAYLVNMDSKILYYAYAGNLKDYVEGKVDTDADVSVDNSDKKYSKTFAEGDSSAEIKNYNFILYYLDYLSDEPGTKFTAETTKAVKSYQESHNIGLSGVFDKQTMQSLDDEVIEYKQGKSSDDIKKYNNILKSLGYLKKSSGKNFTAETKLAVEKYQKKKKMTVTGTINVQTRRSLDSDSSKK